MFVAGPHFGNKLQVLETSPIPREMAKALSMLALAFWLTNRSLHAIVCLVAAAVFQPAYGLWLGLVMCAVTAATLLASTVWALVVITVSAVVLALVAGAALELSVLGQARELVFVVAEFRNPRHMLLTAQSFRG